MEFLWILPVMISFAGAYFMFKLNFFYLLHPIKTFRKAACCLREKGAFISFSLALAGTLGIGNIVGVAVGISVGGAGAVFWIFVSSFFSMILKYCESSLSSEIGNGKGMIGIIKSTFGRASDKISLLYAVLILLICFFMGAGLQSASICECAFATLSLPNKTSALILLFVMAVSLYIGAKKIEKITAIAIPLTTIIYIFLCILTVILNFDALPNAVLRVVRDAFEADSAIGGVFGFFTSKQIKEGYLRGILSNEAGAGTSTIAHSLNKSSDSGAVGVMGMLEVVFDTFILCMLTAFSALVCIEDFSNLSGIAIIYKSIGAVIGAVSEYLLLICIFTFAYSTIVCWYYYGRFAYKHLFGEGRELLFAFLFLSSVYFGCCVPVEILITLSDVVLLMLSVITLSALKKNSDRIKTLSERSGLT